MTERLYYTDAYRQTFDATVIACTAAGAHAEVVLDRTAFYPTSGGQPFDVGTLGGARVLDVIDREDGTIAHLVDAPLTTGARVEGAIDWARRFDHMQQHTGQHVLSAAFDRLSGVRTESFHLGRESSTIDLAREVTATELAAAEDEANRIVWEDRLVAVRVVSPAEAATLPLRKEPARTGPLRLIDVHDFDLSACGGTHVARTGAVGIIAVAGIEKFRGGSRVEFLCGGRALRRFRAWRDALAASMRVLSVAPHELAGAIDRLQQDNKALGRAARTLQEQLAVHEAGALVARGTLAGDRTVVVEALDGWDAAGLKAMASAAAARPGVAVALFSTSVPALCVVARSQGVTVDAGAVLKALAGRFGGKGGGKPDLAQGGGLTGNTQELLGEATKLLSA
jgi:alanyl-tRNA synthetase